MHGYQEIGRKLGTNAMNVATPVVKKTVACDLMLRRAELQMHRSGKSSQFSLNFAFMKFDCACLFEALSSYTQPWWLLLVMQATRFLPFFTSQLVAVTANGNSKYTTSCVPESFLFCFVFFSKKKLQDAGCMQQQIEMFC